MDESQTKLQARLALVDGVLDGAFFSPLHVNDWLGFCFGQPALLGLEEEEVLDLFVRAAIATETIYPEIVEGRSPLAWLWALPDARPVLAQVLASLRHDRPLLFHRVLFSLPAISRGEINPEDFELAEDFLQKALGPAMELSENAGHELDTIHNRALAAAGQDLDRPDHRLIALAQEVLTRPEALDLATDSELRMWLSVGEGLSGVEPALAPGVMAEVWTRWVGAVTGARPDLDILTRWLPALALTTEELALFVPPDRRARHVINAVCPYCSAQASLRLGSRIEPLSGCPHLIYVGTSDEVHVLEVLSHFDLGADFKALLASYYQSPSDLELFATIVNDLYEMLRSQGRLDTAAVTCASAPQAFYNLRAYFAGPPAQETTRH